MSNHGMRKEVNPTYFLFVYLKHAARNALWENCDVDMFTLYSFARRMSKFVNFYVLFVICE